MSFIEEREKVGTKASIVGIVTNAALFVLKFILGSMMRSVAVIADGFNNLSDAASSIVSLIGFKVAGKKPDAKHPFGYGRIEYIAALVVSFLILTTGLSVIKDSFANIIKPESLSVTLAGFIGLGISIVAKIVLGLYTKRLGKKIDSISLIASGTDALNDVVVTFATVISMVVFMIFKVNIDGYIGCVVAFFIIKAGIEVVTDALGPLLGQPADKEVVDKIEEIILSGEGIVGVHDLVVHNYGPGRIFASAHAEIPSDCDLLRMHDIIDQIETKIFKEINVEITIHFDPIDVNNDNLARMREKVAEIVNNIDSTLKFHDFRMVSGHTHTNLIFDIVYPYNCKLKEEEVLEKIDEKIDELSDFDNMKYFTVIKVDYPKV
ncbi:MAG: cation transporter [Spirochaetales bacterium]|nr:cation transporter [Spirochaetales bacterium]